MRGARAFTALFAASVLVAACGSGSTSVSAPGTSDLPATGGLATTPPPVGPGVTAAPVAPAARPAGGEYATTPVSVPPGDAAVPALLTGVRAAAQDGFDRVTFEFSNRLPGYSVDPVIRPVLQDGSGDEVPVEGAALLEVRMTPASSTDLSAGGEQTYLGPSRFKPGTPDLAEVIQAGDFEANLTWVIGLARGTSFKVSTLDSPPRLVVDVKTP